MTAILTAQVRRGFTLLEAVLALAVLVMIGLLFAAILPVSLRGARQSSHYAQASGLAQHKIAQIRGAGFLSAQSPAALAGQGIVDSSTASSPAVPYTASFAGTDHLLADASGPGLYPAGTTATVTITDYAAKNPAVPAGTVADVTVTIHWQSGTISDGSYSTSALIVQTPHS